MSFKLDKEVKKKWTDALRSGEYKQGKGKSHDTMYNTYCCLGVAVNLGIFRNETCAFVSAHDIPQLDQVKLANFNDGFACDKKSFCEIADFIDENY